MGEVSYTRIPTAGLVATTSNVNDLNTNQTLLSANSKRKSFHLWNDSTVVAYVKFGATATTSSYTFQMSPGGYYEMQGEGVYGGQIDCIWASDASGAMRITEVV